MTLVIDSEEGVRQSIGEMLALQGFIVLTAANGREAMAL